MIDIGILGEINRFVINRVRCEFIRQRQQSNQDAVVQRLSWCWTTLTLRRLPPARLAAQLLISVSSQPRVPVVLSHCETSVMSSPVSLPFRAGLVDRNLGLRNVAGRRVQKEGSVRVQGNIVGLGIARSQCQ